MPPVYKKAKQGNKCIEIVQRLTTEKRCRISYNRSPTIGRPQSTNSASLTIPLFSPPQPKYYELRRAVIGGDVSQVKRLIEAGVTPDELALATEGDYGVSRTELTSRTLLHCLALNSGSREVGELLIKAHVPINAQDCNGFTALHIAVTGKTGTELVEFLIECGAAVNTKNKMGRSPLASAIITFNLNVTKQLLGAEANVAELINNAPVVFQLLGCDARNKGEADFKRILTLLANFGVALDAKDCEGCTLFEKAVSRKKQVLVQALLSSNIVDPEQIEAVLPGCPDPGIATILKNRLEQIEFNKGRAKSARKADFPDNEDEVLANAFEELLGENNSGPSL